MEEKESDHFTRLEKHFCITTYFKNQPLIKLVQCEEDWFEARKKFRVTGSMMGSAIGLGRFKKTEDTYVKALLHKEETFNWYATRAMMWGKEMEPLAKQFLRDKFYFEIREIGTFIYKEDPRMASSPDGVCVDVIRGKKLTMLEIKCPYSRKVSSKIEPDYMCQMYGEMSSAEVDNCIFFVWTPKMFAMWYIEFDQIFWKEYCYPRLKHFCDLLDRKARWTDYVENLSPERVQDISNGMQAKVKLICVFRDRYDHLGGLKWAFRYPLVDGDKVHITPTDLLQLQQEAGHVLFGGKGGKPKARTQEPYSIPGVQFKQMDIHPNDDGSAVQEEEPDEEPEDIEESDEKELLRRKDHPC